MEQATFPHDALAGSWHRGAFFLLNNHPRPGSCGGAHGTSLDLDARDHPTDDGFVHKVECLDPER